MTDAIRVSSPITGTDKTLSFEAGHLAQLADGAVVARIGDTMLLATVAAAKSVREGIDFFPLTVDIEGRPVIAKVRAIVPVGDIASRTIEVRLTLPKPIADAVGMPVTFTVLLDGKVLGEEVYQQDGAFIFEKTVQPGMCAPGPVAVTLRVNKAKPPVPGGDARELGAVIAGFGFK